MRCQDYGCGVAEADADPLASGDPDPDPDPDGSGSADGVAGIDGIGKGVGSGAKRDGISSALSTMIARKMAKTMMTHGRASVSLRVGRAPR